jgi:hypothetical protein
LFFFIFIPESVHAIAIVVVVIFAILIYAFSTGKKLEKKFKNSTSLRFIRVINVKFEEVKINPKKRGTQYYVSWINRRFKEKLGVIRGVPVAEHIIFTLQNIRLSMEGTKFENLA